MVHFNRLPEGVPPAPKPPPGPTPEALRAYRESVKAWSQRMARMIQHELESTGEKPDVGVLAEAGAVYASTLAFASLLESGTTRPIATAACQTRANEATAALGRLWATCGDPRIFVVAVVSAMTQWLENGRKMG